MLKNDKAFKVICCCGCGLGTCQIVSMKVKRVMQKLGIKGSCEPDSVSGAKSSVSRCDFIFTNINLAASFKDSDKAIICGLKNVTSEDEIEASFRKHIEL